MLTFTDEQQKIVDFIMNRIDDESRDDNIVISGQGGVQPEKQK